MKDGFIKIACATPEVKVADCPANADRIILVPKPVGVMAITPLFAHDVIVRIIIVIEPSG